MRHVCQRQLQFLCLFLLLFAAPASAQIRLTGNIIEDTSEQPVSGVHVEVFTASWFPITERTTDESGRFMLTLPREGSYRIRASRIGYKQVDAPILDTRDATALAIQLRMSPEAIPLAPLEIVARTRAEQTFSDLSTFEDRRSLGLGHFFTREDVERLRPGRVTDLVGRVPGVRLESSGNGMHRTVRMARANSFSGYCPVQLFVDGLLVNRRSAAPGQGSYLAIDDVVSPWSIEAIEVYKGLATVPAAFLTPDARCGVVAIWTRRGKPN